MSLELKAPLVQPSSYNDHERPLFRFKDSSMRTTSWNGPSAVRPPSRLSTILPNINARPDPHVNVPGSSRTTTALSSVLVPDLNRPPRLCDRAAYGFDVGRIWAHGLGCVGDTVPCGSRVTETTIGFAKQLVRTGTFSHIICPPSPSGHRWKRKPELNDATLQPEAVEPTIIEYNHDPLYDYRDNYKDPQLDSDGYSTSPPEESCGGGARFSHSPVSTNVAESLPGADKGSLSLSAGATRISRTPMAPRTDSKPSKAVEPKPIPDTEWNLMNEFIDYDVDAPPPTHCNTESEARHARFSRDQQASVPGRSDDQIIARDPDAMPEITKPAKRKEAMTVFDDLPKDGPRPTKRPRRSDNLATRSTHTSSSLKKPRTSNLKPPLISSDPSSRGKVCHVGSKRRSKATQATGSKLEPISEHPTQQPESALRPAIGTLSLGDHSSHKPRSLEHDLGREPGARTIYQQGRWK